MLVSSDRDSPLLNERSGLPIDQSYCSEYFPATSELGIISFIVPVAFQEFEPVNRAIDSSTASRVLRHVI